MLEGDKPRGSRWPEHSLTVPRIDAEVSARITPRQGQLNRCGAEHQAAGTSIAGGVVWGGRMNRR